MHISMWRGGVSVNRYLVDEIERKGFITYEKKEKRYKLQNDYSLVI
jgi:hypothetical protein